VGRVGVLGEVPENLQRFEPERDLEAGMIVRVHIEAEESNLKRGWELAVVTSVNQTQDD
jgi:hypothetical protein